MTENDKFRKKEGTPHRKNDNSCQKCQKFVIFKKLFDTKKGAKNDKKRVKMAIFSLKIGVFMEKLGKFVKCHFFSYIRTRKSKNNIYYTYIY